MRATTLLCLLISSVLFIATAPFGCKDAGSDPSPIQPELMVSESVVSLAPGDSVVLTISGGTPPYSLSSPADTVTRASVSDSTLTIVAIGIGISEIVVQDNGSPRLQDKVTVNVSSGLMVSQSLVTLVSGDSVSLTISGGMPFYTFSSQGNPAVTQASITGSELKIVAIGVGTSQIVVQDSASPPSQFTVTVNVAALVMFSTQVQPIFTNRCVNQGCHPGNGAPFSLRVGESYGQLVSVTATNGPCAGIPRVKPFSTDSSALYRRILGTCGLRMPLNLPPLPSDERDVIEDWIDQGAQNN
ncbi:MAG: hypothetical protein O7D34_01155 [Ignavibacteria bacterium]|nr:hypothetical protein [Ignavibacteria bacterium]